MTLVVGIAGGTGSGKTTIARALAAELPGDRCALIEFDSYYIDRSSLSPDERAQLNYDHPDALDRALLASHLRTLKAREHLERALSMYREMAMQHWPEQVDAALQELDAR